MEVKAFAIKTTETNADTLLLLIPVGGEAPPHSVHAVDDKLGGAINHLLSTGDFSGKLGETTRLYPHGTLEITRVILSGLGDEPPTVETLRQAVGHGIRQAQKHKAQRVAIALPPSPLSDTESAAAIAEAALLSAYQYMGQKNAPDEQSRLTSLELLTGDAARVAEVTQGIQVGSAFAAGAISARDMVNLPPNICTPIYLASRARNIADQTNMRIEVLERTQMESLKMGALLAVAQGSETPPRFIVLEHNADQAETLDTIVLVGKGVTFDTGGYNLKTGEGMLSMKADMSGAAAVIGAMQIIAMLGVPLHVVGLAPAADNMISGKAYRPLEVITASNDKTIEIINTDAEGRLLLADALVYAKRYDPAAVVDIATLTGACVVALGKAAAGLFVTDDTLRAALMRAADVTNERVWELPLYPEYKKAIESDTADIKNTGGRAQGVGTSAIFLKEFVDYPAWAHIDMAGLMLNVEDNAYVPAKGASGFGARLLAEFTRQWAANGSPSA